MSGRDYVGLARAYEDDVLADRIPACKWVKLACARNRRDRERADRADPAFPYVFDPLAATRVCLGAEQLPHVKGPLARIVGQDPLGRPRWNPIQLEPWQCWFLTTLFGWQKAQTHLRRFRVALMLVPRKNAKSTLAATVAAYMLTSDGESGAECYCAATMRDQAKVVAEILWEMARRSPAFREYFGVKLGAKTTRVLEVPATASKFMPLSADAHTLDALNVSFAIVDELHAHKTRAVWDVLDTATGARLQPLMLATTTAGTDIGGICYELVQYLHQILEGVLEDEAFFGIDYTIDDGDDWRNPAIWRKANPNYAVSVQPDDLERKARAAEHTPGSVNNFLTKHLNVWVKAAASWMPMEDWQACADPALTLEALATFPCWIGVDLAEVRDIAAVVALFELPDTYAAVGRFYLPEDTIERSPIAQYVGWARQGSLIATPGGATDYQRIEDDIVAWCETLQVREVAFDRALAAQMSQRLMARLGPEPEVITVGQSVDVINPAMQWLEKLVIERRFVHTADPVLTWMASNVVVQRNHKGEIYPRKAGGKDSHHKIDGITALLTVGTRALAGEHPPSVYETRGVVTL